MAWRFKASKFKNAAPIVPKPEACVRDICVGSYQTYGNNIAASAAFMAFIVDHNGSSLGVLPIDDCGRKSKSMPLLHAHSDTVTDLDFSNFHDGLLATASQDCMVKIWNIPEKGLEENLCNAEVTFSHRQRRVECVSWHPTVDSLLTTASFTTLTLWDVLSEKELYSTKNDCGLIQSISWKSDGVSLAFHTKDKTVSVVDPRGDKITHSADSHQSIKDSRVVWLGETNRILTTGFDSARQREVYIRDLRNFKTPEKTLVLDSSTGILIPLYDPDTCMLFLAGKGDTTISYLEVTEREPYLVEGIRHSGEQTKGACLVPKRALNVMQAEVNRLLQLTSSSVIPIMYQVPRKSYRDFHSELFPSTAGSESKVIPSQWMQGSDLPVPKISLNPADKQAKQVHRGNLDAMRKEIQENMDNAAAKVNVTKPLLETVQPKPFHCNLTNTRGLIVENNETNDNLRNKQKNDEDVKVHQNGNPESTPPKPLPRVSRAGSIGSDGSEESAPKPVARPRTNSVQAVSQPGFICSINITGGYKPRLGPKPFTPPKLDSTTSGGDFLDRTASLTLDNEASNTSLPDLINSNAVSVNGNEKTSPESPQPDHENNDEEDGCVQSSPTEEDDEGCGGGDMNRGGVRASIAERRKMYEARSQSVQEPSSAVSPVPLRRRDSLKAPKGNSIKEEDSTPKPTSQQVPKNPAPTPVSNAPKRTSTVFGNKERVGVPLGGPGGKIAVLELSRPGKLPDGVTPTLVNATNIMDFSWDPFDNRRLVVGCDDGTVKVWLVPETGLTEATNTPDRVLQAHSEKIYCLKFHPLAADILATTSYDMTIRIWDISTLQMAFCLKAEDHVVALAWSPCGRRIAAATRSSSILIFEPRQGTTPVLQGKGPGGTRGARLVWALGGHYIAVMGFDKVSERQIMVFKSTDLSAPLATVGLDVSPAILIPFYDEDSSTLFLTGRGDSTIYTFEVSSEQPHLNPLSHHRCGSLHQGLSFLPKNCIDVTQVEFARALRLTNTTIEPLSFTVPRIKSDLFQDDLFPLTKVTWEATMTATEWLDGCQRPQPRISLKPNDMHSLSEGQGAPVVAISNKEPLKQAPTGRTPWTETSIKQKQEQIQKSVSSRVEVNLKLEQDKMEGVDELEWND